MIDFRQAEPKPLFLRGPSPATRLFVLVTLSVGFMVADYRFGHLDAIRDTLSVIVYPVRALINVPFSAAGWLGENLAQRERLIADNEALRDRALAADLALQRLATLEAENARLRALMDSTARVADRVLVSGIMAVDLDPIRHRVVIDKGARDGAFDGQALLDATGIVGQVTRAEPLSSEAVLITDPGHATPVEINRNGMRTIAVGTGNVNRLGLPFLPNNADIQVGDLLVSSGLGGTFPAGYPVGIVSEVVNDPGKPFASVSATPAAAIDRNREVLLVWSGAKLARPDESDAEAAGTDPAAAESAEDPATDSAGDDATANDTGTDDAGATGDPAAPADGP